MWTAYVQKVSLLGWWSWQDHVLTGSGHLFWAVGHGKRLETNCLWAALIWHQTRDATSEGKVPWVPMCSNVSTIEGYCEKHVEVVRCLSVWKAWTWDSGWIRTLHHNNNFCYGMYSHRRFLTWLRASRLFAQELVDECRLPRGMISNDQDLRWYEINCSSGCVSKFCCFGWYAHVWYDHAPTSADSMLSCFSLVATALQRWIPDA